MVHSVRSTASKQRKQQCPYCMPHWPDQDASGAVAHVQGASRGGPSSGEGWGEDENQSVQTRQLREMGRRVTSEMRQLWLSGYARSLCQSLVQYHIPLTVGVGNSPKPFPYSPEQSFLSCDESILLVESRGKRIFVGLVEPMKAVMLVRRAASGRVLLELHDRCASATWLPAVQTSVALQSKELQEWAHSPEEFHQQIGAGAWQDSARSCAETLFATLLQVKCATMSICYLEDSESKCMMSLSATPELNRSPMFFSNISKYTCCT